MLKLSNNIKMIITDFDGIITDNNVYVHEDGTTTRKLNYKDIMGFSILKKKGYKISIISGESNSAIDFVNKKFNIDEVHTNIRNKFDVLIKIIEKYNLKEDEYLYIGDDVNDIASLKFSKFKITVPNAVQSVKNIENIQVTNNRGGDGAFREVVDCLVTL